MALIQARIKKYYPAHRRRASFRWGAPTMRDCVAVVSCTGWTILLVVREKHQRSCLQFERTADVSIRCKTAAEGTLGLAKKLCSAVPLILWTTAQLPWPIPSRQERFRSTSARFAQPARVGFHPAEGRTQRSVGNRSGVLRHGCEIKWTHDRIGSDPQKFFVGI
jgi:hypothetical protein